MHQGIAVSTTRPPIGSAPIAEPFKVKRVADVEALVHWAYVDELPLARLSSAEGIWDRIEDIGHGGIDVGHGAAQRYAHFGLPHPDAHLIEAAVGKLPDLTIDWSVEGEAIVGPLASMLKFGPDRKVVDKVGWYDQDSQTGAREVRWTEDEPDRRRDVILVRTLSASMLVHKHAVMGTRPEWHADGARPLQTPARNQNGAAVVGKCYGKDRYEIGAYCPLRWSPSPLEIAVARADYLAWWRGLAMLADCLDLGAHTLTGPAVPEMPWLGPPVAPAAVHRAPARAHARLPLHPSRPSAGPPASKWRPPKRD